jgi:hypothetical protein
MDGGVLIRVDHEHSRNEANCNWSNAYLNRYFSLDLGLFSFLAAGHYFVS